MNLIIYDTKLNVADNKHRRFENTNYRMLAFFAALALIFLWVMIKVELPMLMGFNPEWENKVRHYVWILHLHATLGTIALMIAPFQFLVPLRDTKPQLHRFLGRLYAVSVCITAVLAMWIAVFHLTPSEAWAAFIQAFVWLCSTLIAVITAMKHKLDDHRLWIMRSYALTCTFVLSRFAIDVLHLPFNSQFGGASTFIIELSVIVLLFVQYVFRRRAT